MSIGAYVAGATWCPAHVARLSSAHSGLRSLVLPLPHSLCRQWYISWPISVRWLPAETVYQAGKVRTKHMSSVPVKNAIVSHMSRFQGLESALVRHWMVSASAVPPVSPQS